MDDALAKFEVIHSVLSELLRYGMVAAGGVYLDPAIAGKVVGSLLGKSVIVGDPAAAELSERETDVVRLIAQGYSNKEIAIQLNLSVKTVETYKARAMEKIGLDSRVAIVRYALQRGWHVDGQSVRPDHRMVAHTGFLTHARLLTPSA